MIILILVFFGLCFGSFVNALVWRVHEQSKSKKNRQDRKLSVLNGRSMCPNCHHALAGNDLVPVFSWLYLKGKCRYCHKPISAQYPIVEASCAALFWLSYLAWPYGFSLIGWIEFILWLLILVGLVALFIYDLKWMILPDKITYPLIVLAAVSAIAQAINTDNIAKFLINLSLSLFISSGIFYILFQISNGKWIGGGDVKFGFIFGLLLASPIKSVLVIFGASILGTLLAVPLLFSHKLKMKAQIAFGPFLIIATVLIYLYGQNLVDWYRHILLV